ncbi:cysteine-rich hydrophobic domain-containing protein 1 isoform X2 [Sciurus carolinensis]|uniref:cysteine-rich hydrophobic domain-containing protein 1 isoform X2 n=1 Tax=Sciurus carolinensis TaxID=30640 RepID=UPI001FB32725|nr:cysteine-rich hydrophobic domain-containing protein 1 isoform X2 [Sciurus carolinensis]
MSTPDKLGALPMATMQVRRVAKEEPLTIMIIQRNSVRFKPAQPDIQHFRSHAEMEASSISEERQKASDLFCCLRSCFAAADTTVHAEAPNTSKPAHLKPSPHAKHMTTPAQGAIHLASLNLYLAQLTQPLPRLAATLKWRPLLLHSQHPRFSYLQGHSLARAALSLTHQQTIISKKSEDIPGSVISHTTNTFSSRKSLDDDGKKK